MELLFKELGTKVLESLDIYSKSVSCSCGAGSWKLLSWSSTFLFISCCLDIARGKSFSLSFFNRFSSIFLNFSSS